MHNIQELEKKWLNYKIKSFIPLFTISLFSIILLIFIFTFYKKDIVQIPAKKIIITHTEPIKERKEEQVVIKETVPIIKTIVPKVQKTLTSKETLVLTPSLDFIKNLRSNTKTSYQSKSFPSTKETPQVPKVAQNKTLANTPIQEEIIKNEIIKQSIKITKQETQADIQHVIKRFQKNNNPALSLFVAKKYYKLKDYKKSYNYALITNQINNEIDESWIIFTKSLVKIGKKDKAIKTLKKYIEHSHSANAKILLDDIQLGKFR